VDQLAFLHRSPAVAVRMKSDGGARLNAAQCSRAEF
jgi:hypothetical protein